MEKVQHHPNRNTQKEIANIFNKVAETGENITELILGLLRTLQKRGKEKGPDKLLRPMKNTDNLYHKKKNMGPDLKNTFPLQQEEV